MLLRSERAQRAARRGRYTSVRRKHRRQKREGRRRHRIGWASVRQARVAVKNEKGVRPGRWLRRAEVSRSSWCSRCDAMGREAEPPPTGPSTSTTAVAEGSEPGVEPDTYYA